LKIRVTIVKENDFQGKNWEQFAARIDELGLGQLSPEQQAISDGLGETPGQRIKRLPQTFQAMSDSPMRSATGRIFDLLGIKGSSFNAVVQFKLGQILTAGGVIVAKGAEFSDETIGRLLFEVFAGPRAQEIRAALLANALEAQRDVIVEQFDLTQRRYLRIRADLNRGISFIADGAGPAVQGVEARTANVFTSMRNGTFTVLPKTIGLSRDMAFYGEIFRSVQGNVMQAMAHGDLSDLLGKVADQGIDHLSRSEKKRLKQLRKNTLQLRAAYRFFSDDKSAPDQLDEFSFQLGQLNDQIAKWQSGRQSPKAIQKTAQGVRKILDKNRNLFGRQIEIASLPDFVKFNRERLAKIEKVLYDRVDKKIAGYTMSVDDYHMVRRRIREFAYFFDMLLDQNGDATLDIMASMTFKLSYDMGQIKDGLTIGKAADKYKNPGARPTQIDPDSRALIEKLIVIMKASLDAIDPQ
jgi:CHAD domain-containing protein